MADQKTKTIEKNSMPAATGGARVVRAELKNMLQSPQKLRLVADLIRGKYVDDAIGILTFTRKKASEIIGKALKSAIANAEHNNGMDRKSLVVSKIVVNEGMKLPGYRFASRGRVDKFLRRRAHVLIELTEK